MLRGEEAQRAAHWLSGSVVL